MDSSKGLFACRMAQSDITGGIASERPWQLKSAIKWYLHLLPSKRRKNSNYSGPLLIQTSNIRLLGFDLCTFYLMPMLRMEQGSCTRSLEHSKMLEFRPFEAWKGRNTTIICTDNGQHDRKETAVLIMIHYRRYLYDDSHIWLFCLSGHGLVLL